MAWPRAGVAGVLALALLLVFQTVDLGSDAGADDGVSWYGGGGFSTKSRPGKSLGFGGHLRNDGDRAITLLSASFDDDVPPQQGLLDDALVFDLEAAGGGLIALWWPADEIHPYTRPLAGHVVEPGEEVGLVFVVEVRGQGPMAWEQGTITYEVGGEVREEPGVLGLHLCPSFENCGA